MDEWCECRGAKRFQSVMSLYSGEWDQIWLSSSYVLWVQLGPPAGRKRGEGGASGIGTHVLQRHCEVGECGPWKILWQSRCGPRELGGHIRLEVERRSIWESLTRKNPPPQLDVVELLDVLGGSGILCLFRGFAQEGNMWLVDFFHTYVTSYCYNLIASHVVLSPKPFSSPQESHTAHSWHCMFAVLLCVFGESHEQDPEEWPRLMLGSFPRTQHLPDSSVWLLYQ